MKPENLDYHPQLNTFTKYINQNTVIIHPSLKVSLLEKMDTCILPINTLIKNLAITRQNCLESEEQRFLSNLRNLNNLLREPNLHPSMNYSYLIPRDNLNSPVSPRLRKLDRLIVQLLLKLEVEKNRQGQTILTDNILNYMMELEYLCLLYVSKNLIKARSL